MNRKVKKSISALTFTLLFFQETIGFCASLSVNDAIAMALQNNLDIKIASTKENQAEANLAATKAQSGVTVSLGSSSSISDGISDGVDRDFERSNSTSISASYPLYTAGKNKLNTNIKEQALEQSKLNTQRTAENITYNTVKTYYDILEDQKNIDVDQESVDNYDKHLQNVQQLYSAGSVAKSDLLRSEVALADAKQSLISAQNTLVIDQLNLKNILKMDKNEPLYLTDDFRYIPFDMELDYCLSYAAENRKDLKQTELDYEIAKKNVELAKADYKPTVNASVGTDWSKQPLPSEKDHSYTVGVSANWDVFDNGLTKANVNAAEAGLDQAELTLQQQKDSIDVEVRQAYLNMRDAEKRFNLTQTSVDQAKEDLFIAQEKYRVGEGIILDIIDAQLALSTARINHISAQYDYARYKAEVENAMGLDEENI
ncbi:TolC family protein [Pectinatus cerevisiiphilus]|uniref:Outer membrane protein TolC n=1 Tax=Pectinatus cerevisiiphilus TaxID=86956 RepID=A0A4R3K5B7_9FIRM|nr:TolC family protein [Pectinatus cerevisiiphilus]TCS78018.1 outer membrane protein TolC [Pectinatus cerevisiiphilus]